MAWVMIGLVLLFVLIYWNTVTYQNFQIIGVAFAPEHAGSNEVKALQGKFKQQQVIIGGVFITLALLAQLEVFHGFRDAIHLFLLMVYIIATYIPFQRLQEKLIHLKHEKGWIYAEQKRRADLRVSREKGEAAPSQLWIWLIWLLGFIPLLMAALFSVSWEVYLPLLIVGLVQILLPLSYNKAISQKTPVVFEDSDLTLVYTRRYERIQARSYLMMALTLNVFLIVLTWLTLAYRPGLSLVILLIGFIVALVGIIFDTFQKNKDLQADFFEAEVTYINESSGRYKWGFYHNPDDHRLFVPKQASGMGVTINIARPVGKVIMGLTLALVAGVLIMVVVMSTASFDVNVDNQALQIEVPLYGSQIDFEDIETIELTQTPLDGTRTNGYGGQDKAYGYFNLEAYGSVKLYVYPSHPYHIDVLLDEGSEPRWVIFNEPTAEATEVLYEAIKAEVNE